MATGTEMDMIPTSGLFAGDHQAVNAWAIEGITLPPHLRVPMESMAKGDSRHQTDNVNQLWNSTVVVNTPVTSGGGATKQPGNTGNSPRL